MQSCGLSSAVVGEVPVVERGVRPKASRPKRLRAFPRRRGGNAHGPGVRPGAGPVLSAANDGRARRSLPSAGLSREVTALSYLSRSRYASK